MKPSFALRLTVLPALLGLGVLCRADQTFFSVPDFQELPPDIQVISEKTGDGVTVTELYVAGAPFKSEPTKIYGFYCRPEKGGKFPGVLELHGAGMSASALSPDAGIGYARNGFACFVMDWCGASAKRLESGWRHSVFKSDGNLAAPVAAAESGRKPEWRIGTIEENGLRNGVMFARRVAMFLKSRPEVDADRLCVSGMSAGAHLTLLILGAEPSFKAAAVKYGCGFIRDIPGSFGGYFGPIYLCSREEQDAWLARFDPKHNLPNYKADVLMLSGTDDIFFWMPNVLATYRAIPTRKRLMMFPNENHGYVGNWQIPLSWFRSRFGLAPAWPSVEAPKVAVDGENLRLEVKASGPAPIAKVAFWVKRMPIGKFRGGMGEKGKPETFVKWVETPAALADGVWRATVSAPKADEQVVAYAMVEDENGVKDSSDTVETPDYLRWRGISAFKPWEQVFKAAEFKSCTLTDPAMADKVRKAGDLRGVAAGSKDTPAIGFFTYEASIPCRGWYELIVPGANSECEFRVGGQRAFGVVDGKVGSFWLEPEMRNYITLQRYVWNGMPPIRELTLRAVPPDRPAARIRVTLADDRSLIRKGEALRLKIETGALPKPSELLISITEGQTTVAERRVSLPDWPCKCDLPVELLCDQEGAFTVTFKLDGVAVDRKDLRPIAFQVVDTSRQKPAGGETKRKLIQEIDCVATEPDFTCGETRVTNGAPGAYRESGDKGYLAHMNSTDPTWFAYKVGVPEKQRLYQIEVDYPDDALRTYVIAVREAAGTATGPAIAYPTAGGVDSGGEFSLSNTMLTHTLLHWATTTDLRVLIIPTVDGRRAAAARIRVYQVEGELPLLDTPVIGGRAFANWYEEGGSVLGVYNAPDKTMSGMLTAAERWARTIRHIGGDTLWMTMVVYQFGLYPSNYNVSTGGPYSPDFVRAILMKCEKYGMRFIGEFHPEARELDWPLYADPGRLHRAYNRNGAVKSKSTDPLYNPLWPKNQEWYLGMIGEFVDRYKDSPAFKGISLRLMTWVNPGLNNFHSIDWGYDDYTIGLFEKETGKSIPVDAGDTARFARRYDWLLANARDEWLDWRCRKITEIYRKIAARTQQARPDLLVFSDYMMEGVADPREIGVDPVKLQAISGVVLVGGDFRYGRRGNETITQKTRDCLLDPAEIRRFAAPDGRCAFIDSAHYMEATGVVAPPAALGFPADTKTSWMSGVVNPAGRHSIERWAIQLAETDTAFLADGGNAYTVGQPVLREFLREYRALPDVAFTPVESARDPVAVWVSGGARESSESKESNHSIPANLSKNDFLFYAVNRERYPVKVRITLKNPGKVERLTTKEAVELKNGALAFDLKPYELRTFSTDKDAAIATVAGEIPEADRKHAEGLAAFLAALAADAKAGKLGVELRPDELRRLEEQSALAKAELGKGHLWRVRTLAEHHALRAIYDRCKRQPPNLRELGPPVPPEGAWLPDELFKRLGQGKAEAVTGDELWPGQKLLATTEKEVTFELELPFEGMAGVDVGRLAGGTYGPLELSVNGKTVGALRGGAATARTPRPALDRLEGVVSLGKGKNTIGFKRRSGERTALAFVALTPVFSDIVSGNWQVAGPFAIAKPGERVTEEARNAAMTAKDWQPPEATRDPSAVFAFADGTTGGWRTLDGTADFIDFGRAFGQYSGTICYARTGIQALAATSVRLLYGMDYWMKIWVNGELVKNLETHGGAPFKGQFQVDVPLKAGANELLVKVASGSLGNGFWMAVSDPGNLRFSAKRR